MYISKNNKLSKEKLDSRTGHSKQSVYWVTEYIQWWIKYSPCYDKCRS